MKIIRNSAEFMSSSRLFHDYMSNPETVGDFYPAPFGNESAWVKVMDRIRGRGRDYGDLVRVLRRQNLALGAGSASLENVDKLAGKSAFAVVTGQQVGLLTGPLYTIYKAMTVIKLAHYLHEKHDVEVIPIFWIESNDHDMQEVNHIDLLDSGDELIKLEYMPKNYVADCSMKDVILDDTFGDLISDLENRFPNTEFKKDVFHIIRESYSPSVNLGHGFGRMMAEILGKYGLVFLDPSDPEIKSLMSPIFEREINSPLESMKIVNSAGEELKSRGYTSQIEKSWDSTGLFIEENGVRCKLFFRDGYFKTDKYDLSMSGAELLEIVRDEPQRLSPNVALRPVTQDYMIPTIAYVAGPGETSYFAQLANLYAFMDVNMPVIYPRAGLTIVESKVERIMEKNGLEISDLLENHESLFSRISKDMAAGKLDDLLEASNSGMDDIFGKLSSGLVEFDPGLKNIVESAKRKVDHQMNILKERAYKAQRDRNDILRAQVKRACMNIYPGGKPQERVFNIVQYLVLYGLNFMDDLMATVELDLN